MSDESLPDINALFSEHRSRLRRMIQFRMDRRMSGRVDASDVIQEAFIEAARRYQEFSLQKDRPSPFIWLRFLTGQKLCEVQRRHLGVQARDVSREISMQNKSIPGATSVGIAEKLVGNRTSPSQAVARKEMLARVREALESMSDTDREIIAMRHFEQLSNAETAEALKITEAASYRRFIRAMQRLRRIMADQ